MGARRSGYSPRRCNRTGCLAWLMATQESSAGGTPKEAVEAAERACDLTGRRDALCLDTLSAAYASAGRFDEAAATAKVAWQLAQSAGDSSLAEEIHIRLQLYRDRKPYPRTGGRSEGPPLRENASCRWGEESHGRTSESMLDWWRQTLLGMRIMALDRKLTDGPDDEAAIATARRRGADSVSGGARGWPQR